MIKGKTMDLLRKRAERNSSTPRKILSDLYARHDQTEVPEILGVDQTSISDAMIRLNIPRRARRTPAPKGKVARLLTQRGRTTGRSALQMFRLMYQINKLGLVAIANELGVSVQTVHAFAVKHGVNLRRVGRPRSKKTSRAKSTTYTYTPCI